MTTFAPTSTFAPSSPTVALRPRQNRPAALMMIAAMGTLTVTTPFPYVFGVPRSSLIAILCTVFMYASLAGKVAMRYVQFALAYLVAFVPATAFNLHSASLKWPSILQMLAMLVTFCVLGTYFERWLSHNADPVKIKWIERLLLYFFVVSVLELIFKSQSARIQELLYPSRSDLYEFFSKQRELSLYGGRPTAFFSEPSNFAKFLSLMVAAYMTISRCSKKSIFALVILYLVARSVSYFYAAPVMVLAFWRSSRYRSGPERRRGPGSARLFLAGVVAACLLVGVMITQQQRISDALMGQDNSLTGRIALPMQYVMQNAGRLVCGYGLTPQEELTNFTVITYAMSAGHLDAATPMMAATSTTITFLVGIGGAGLAIFLAVMFVFQGRHGVWIAVAFLVSNIINAGYNSSTNFVLSSLLTCLMAYQFSLAKARALPAAHVAEPLTRQRTDQ